MRPPLLEKRGDGVDDLAVEVEPQVVAGREVRKPFVADANHATVDLVDHRVAHRMRASELVEVMAGREPLVDPSGSGQPSPGAGGCARSHSATIGRIRLDLEVQPTALTTGVNTQSGPQVEGPSDT